MPKELDVATGARHIFVRTGNRVELRLDWPSHLMDLLPDDFTLTLSGPEIPQQQKSKSDGTVEDDLVHFEFEWEEKTRTAQLEASGNGQSVVLWQEQVIGDLVSQIDWNDRLHPLLNDPESVEINGDPTGGGSIPDDLLGYQLKDLDASEDSDGDDSDGGDSGDSGDADSGGTDQGTSPDDTGSPNSGEGDSGDGDSDESQDSP